jgi:hypothetical protein
LPAAYLLRLYRLPRLWLTLTTEPLPLRRRPLLPLWPLLP